MGSLKKCHYVKPESFSCAQPLLGKVVYIHPKGRFICLEFGSGSESFRECFTRNQLMKKRENDTTPAKAKHSAELPIAMSYEQEMSRAERLNYVVTQLQTFGSEAAISVSDLDFLTSVTIAPYVPHEIWDVVQCWLRKQAAAIDAYLSLHHMKRQNNS